MGEITRIRQGDTVSVFSRIFNNFGIKFCPLRTRTKYSLLHHHKKSERKIGSGNLKRGTQTIFSPAPDPRTNYRNLDIFDYRASPL